MKIQEYLNTNCPNKEERKRMTSLILANRNLTDELVDLSDFPNLEKVELSDNQVRGHLEVFSYLTKLNDLRIRGNNFRGSLFALSKLNLKYLDIEGNQEINGDIDDLFLSLKTFECRKTKFSKVMKPFNYDLEAWRLVFRPQLFNDDWEKKIEEKINDTQFYLEIAGDNLDSLRNSNSFNISFFKKKELQMNSKVSFLKTKFLEKQVERLEKEIEDLP